MYTKPVSCSADCTLYNNNNNINQTGTVYISFKIFSDFSPNSYGLSVNMSKNTRGATSTTLGSVSYVDLESLSWNPIFGLCVRQAPTGVAVLGRISKLTKDHDSTGKKMSKSEAYCNRGAVRFLDICLKHLSCNNQKHFFDAARQI